MTPEELERELAWIPRITHEDDLPARLRVMIAEQPALQRIVRERIASDRLLDELPEPAPTPGSAEQIVAAALQSRESAGPSRWRVLVPLAAAAAIAAVAWVAALHPDRRGGRDDPPAPELLASLDLLIDWPWIEEHAEELDELAVAELIEVAAEIDEMTTEDDG